MSTSGDLREVLTQRLKRLETSGSASRSASLSSLQGASRGPFGFQDAPISSNGNPITKKTLLEAALNSRRSMSLPGVAQISFSREPSVSPSSAPVVPAVKCEGYLSKFSSGSLTGRWQKRFFVLSNGRLGYFKKAPGPVESHMAVPDKSFSLRKVKEIISNGSGANDREFTIKLGDSSYQLKASTASDMRKWVSALNTALAQKDSLRNHGDGDEESSSSAVDLASVSNSVSSQASDSTILNEDIQAYLHQQRQMVQASAAARKQDTVWEVEVDPDELDRSFIEWFDFTDSDDIKQMSQKLIKGISISLSHLYSTVASEVFDAQVLDVKSQLKRAKSTVQSLRRSTQQKEADSVDPIRTQLNSILMEYVSRIINELVRFLNLRKDIRDASNGDLESGLELIEIVDCVCLMMMDLSSLTVAKTDCSCACCCPNAGDGESCTASDRWKKSLRNILQRLGSELEVTLIERIQDQILSWEVTWEAEQGTCATAPNKSSHALFGTRLSVWLTGWSSELISTCEKEGLGILKDDSRIRYCRRFVSELVASVLIAVLNSAWRQFKRKLLRTQSFAETWKETLRQIAHIRETNTGFWSVFSSQHHELERLEHSTPPEEEFTLALPNLVAFGNEAILLSSFLSETLPEQLPFAPKIWSSCFEGLASTFQNTAIEVAGLVVHFHFIEKHSLDMVSAFKTIQTDSKRTPMIVARDATEKFASELVPFGTHPALKGHIVNLLPSAVIQVYVTGLLKIRPKLKQIKNLLTIFEADLVIFKSLFSETRFNCKDSVVHKAVLPLTVVISFLSERNKQNIEDEVARRLIIAFGAKSVSQVTNALIEIRGQDYTKSERASLFSILDPHSKQSLANEKDHKVSASLSRTETASYLTDAETVWRF
jgi:hypothetical protein